MGKLAKELKRKRQEELLSLFDQSEDHYEELHVADKVYIKMLNGNTQRWQVAEYNQASFSKYRAFGESRRLDDELQQRIQREV